MEFKKKYWIGIVLGCILLLVDIILFFQTKFFIPVIVIAVSLAWTLPWIDYFVQGVQRREYESRFLEFVRNLVGAIRSGMPTSRAIIHVVRTSDYGPLNGHLQHLANQVEWAIPVHKALLNFSKRLDNTVISRAIATVIEAEQAGGNLEDVLESITVSLIEIKKIKEQRRAAIHSQVIQSYVIFFVFLGVMVIIQSLLIPYLGKMQGANIAQGDLGGTFTSFSEKASLDYSSFASFVLSFKDWILSMPIMFTALVLVQGFFAGIIIGKMSEGDLTAGFKHSLILMTIAFFVTSLFGM